MSSEVLMTEIPMCDMDSSHGEALYDSRLPGYGGSWAYVCQVCWEAHGPGELGTGHGQRLVLRS